MGLALDQQPLSACTDPCSKMKLLGIVEFFQSKTQQSGGKTIEIKSILFLVV